MVEMIKSLRFVLLFPPQLQLFIVVVVDGAAVVGSPAVVAGKVVGVIAVGAAVVGTDVVVSSTHGKIIIFKCAIVKKSFHYFLPSSQNPQVLAHFLATQFLEHFPLFFNLLHRLAFRISSQTSSSDPSSSSEQNPQVLGHFSATQFLLHFPWFFHLLHLLVFT